MDSAIAQERQLIELPVLPTTKPSSCDDCGACCRHVGTPPGFAVFFPLKGQTIMEGALESPDFVIFSRMPGHLKRELRHYYDRVQAGKEADRSGHDLQCLWYDETRKRCLHYEHRPTICRNFEVGGEACGKWRSHWGLQRSEA